MALIVIPGPAVLYIVAQSIGGGRSAGLVSALGVATGALVHVAFAVVGLSAVLVASAEAFTAVKLVGAAYLIWLGISTLLNRGGDRVGGHTTEFGSARLYRRGVVVNVLNPKTAIFFLAFLPQFVDPDGPVRLQLMILGLVFVVLAFASDAMWAIAAGAAAGMLRGSATVPPHPAAHLGNGLHRARARDGAHGPPHLVAAGLEDSFETRDVAWRHRRDRRVALSLGVVHRLVCLADRRGCGLRPVEERASDRDGDRQRHPLRDERRVADERRGSARRTARGRSRS